MTCCITSKSKHNKTTQTYMGNEFYAFNDETSEQETIINTLSLCVYFCNEFPCLIFFHNEKLYWFIHAAFLYCVVQYLMCRWIYVPLNEIYLIFILVLFHSSFFAHLWNIHLMRPVSITRVLFKLMLCFNDFILLSTLRYV